jgi:hypothetical protein
LALAIGLAFGLGGRETAGEIVRNWYLKSQEAAPKIQEAASAMQDQSPQRTQSPPRDLDAGQTRPAA